VRILYYINLCTHWPLHGLVIKVLIETIVNLVLIANLHIQICLCLGYKRPNEFCSFKFVLTNQQFMYCWSFKANLDKVSWLNNVYCDCARKCILKPTLLFIASILNINLFLLPFKHVFSISKEQAFFKQPLGTVFLLFLSFCVPLFCNISFLTEVRLFMSMLKPKKVYGCFASQMLSCSS